MSRAYYAAYHKCREWASQIDPHTDFSTSTAHQTVKDVLRTEWPAGASVAYQLHTLGQDRRRADYEIWDQCSRQESLTAVEICERILARVDAA